MRMKLQIIELGVFFANPISQFCFLCIESLLFFTLNAPHTVGFVFIHLLNTPPPPLSVFTYTSKSVLVFDSHGSSVSAAVTWLQYYLYCVKHKTVDQSIL